MRLSIKQFTLILFFTGLLLPFNNCSNIDTSVFRADQGSSLSAGLPTVVINAPNPLRISSNTQLFTLSGTCTPGIYPENYMFWTLHTQNEQFVSDSYTAGGLQFIGVCVGGQYSIDVRVPCPGLVTSGSNCFGLLAPLKLRLRIQGKTATGADAPASSPLPARL